MIIQVYGSGCPNCKRLLENVKTAVSELRADATVEYITDYLKIVNAGILRTPALAIDGKIVVSGRVPAVDEIRAMIGNRP